MPRKVIVTVRLVKEAEQLPPEEVKRDIEKEVRQILNRIPWAAEVEKVAVSD